MGELPTAAIGRMLNAILVATLDHGVMPPSTLAARNVATSGAPLKDCVAAGILAFGHHHGGDIDSCMRYLDRGLTLVRGGDTIDPAGAGDAFTAGLLAGLGWGMGLRRAAEVGSQMTALALESVGPQGYAVNPVEFVHRLEQSYGPAAAAEASAYLLPE